MIIKFKKFIGLIGLIGLIGSIGFSAVAQSAPEFMISWRAINYVPADYQGKILPSKSSRVEISFDLVDKNKIADLSGKNISWYLDGDLLKSGLGAKTVQFASPNNLNKTIRIAVSGYTANDLEESFLIPSAEPEVVIDAKTPATFARNQNLLPVKNHTFEARPFFFNVNNLNGLKFDWRINNKSAEGLPGQENPENPEFLALNLQSSGAPRETELGVAVGVSNLGNQLELGSKSINFVIR